MTKAAPGQSATTATFDDWVVRCQVTDTGKICESTSAVNVKTSSGTIAQAASIVIGQLPGEPKSKILVQLPLGVWLPSGVRLLDETKKEIASLQYTQCQGGGCFAVADVDGAVLDVIGRLNESLLIAYVAQNQNVHVQVSIKGYAAAEKARRGG